MLVQALQLVFRAEIQLDLAAATFTDDANARAQRKAQLLFCRARVHVFRRFFQRFLSCGRWFQRFAHEHFGLAHGQLLRDDFTANAQLRGFVGKTEQRTCVAHGQRAGGDAVAHFSWKLQQPQRVCDRRSIFADRIGDLVLREMQFIGETAIGVRLFDRIQILALNVLDQRRSEQMFVWRLADDDRNLEQTGALGRSAAMIS